MTRASETAAPLPVTDPVDLTARARDRTHPVAYRARPGDLEALAAFLDIQSLESLALEGTLAPWRRDGWELAGQLRARATQACVVTLDPVTEEIDAPVLRRFLPDGGAEPRDGEIGDDDLDAPEPFEDAIDLAAIAVEALALALDPYPRAKGVELGARVYAPPGAEPLTDAAMRPFAGLADLKRKLSDKG
ncbi:MAG: DUF177 domain-containing protein [Paracoccaceae bacterium]